MAVSFTGVARLTVVEATDLHAPDVAGTKSIDPYCIVSIDDGAVARTTHKSKTFNPRWAEVGVFFFFAFLQFAVAILPIFTQAFSIPYHQTKRNLMHQSFGGFRCSLACTGWCPLSFGFCQGICDVVFFFFLHQPAFWGP
jgi:hypothetical protein